MPADAQAFLEGIVALPLRVHPNRTLAAAALARAVEVGLGAYDAFYLVLADALDAILVTADRRLAAAYDRVELIP